MDDDWDSDSEHEAFFEDGLIEEDLIPDDEIPTAEFDSVIEYPDGSKFEGLTMDGKKRTGKLTFSSGNILYLEGAFELDEFVKGKCAYANGDEYEGDWKKGHPHGEGLLKYNEEAKVYIGTFNSGVREGKGTCAYVEGSFYAGQKYEGDWHDGDWHGKGRLTYEDGVIYEGDFATGELHGSGVLTYPDGRKLFAQWVNGDRQNPSRITYPNGDEFVGSVERGTGHRVDGTYTHANGDVYQGLYEDNKRTRGVLTFSSGGPVEVAPKHRYEGEWAFIDGKDRMHGSGKMEYADGKVYQGEWVAGRRSGYGECSYQEGPFEGQVYKGEWRDDKWDGSGSLSMPTGERYEGKFLEGEMHGAGLLTSADGVKHEGIWQNGQEPTTGRWIYPNGDVFTGEIIDGVKTGTLTQQQSSYEDPAALDLSMASQDALNTSFFSDNSADSTHTDSNGDRYVGETNVQGLRHGRGVLTEANGNFYDGQFRGGLKHGRGSYKYKNGDLYEGEFANDMRHGNGTITFAKGGYAKGTWQNNQMHGEKCEFKHRSGLFYLGGFENHRKQGFAELTFPDGSRYTGYVRKNKLHGKGKYLYVNGDVYEGDFEDGYKQGRGKMVHKADGSVYEGGFFRGKKDGKGVLICTDGRKIVGEWKKDVMEAGQQGADTSTASPSSPSSPTVVDPAATSSFLCLPRSMAYGKVK